MQIEKAVFPLEGETFKHDRLEKEHVVALPVMPIAIRLISCATDNGKVAMFAYLLKEGLSTPKTVIMDFVVDPEECVYPMVPAGAPITEMLLV